ncbi:hypothetical protein AMECASPLE_004767 [Ameca splendens]|uniref:Uncharacterized protein n=1 Tax=Ameca splendens TaxID=208324 RepID=A0ABV0XBZ8_9TELE
MGHRERRVNVDQLGLKLPPMASLCVSAPTNRHQVRSNPQPMILQGSAFKVSHSWISQLSAGLRPSSTPWSPSDSQFYYHQASSPSQIFNFPPPCDSELSSQTSFENKALHGQAPNYFCQLLTKHFAPRGLRSQGQNLLDVPRTRLKTKGDCSSETVGQFATAASLCWLCRDLYKTIENGSFPTAFMS